MTGVTAPAAPRQSARLNRPSPLLSLSPEVIDLIISSLFLSEKNRKKGRLELSRVLKVSPVLAPFARRHMFAKVTLAVGDPLGAQLQRLLVDDASGTASGVGEHIRALRIRAPDVPDDAVLEDNPASLVVPHTSLSQTAVLELAIDVMRFMPNIATLEIYTQVGTKESDRADEAAEQSARDELARLFVALRVGRLAICVPHLTNALQVIAERSGWTSSFLKGLMAWNSLASLELWRVSFALPPNQPEPAFKLHTLEIVSSELGGEADLEWFLGPVGGARSGSLRRLIVREVNFASTPGSSTPLRSIFASDDDQASPSFTTTLTFLELSLPTPIDGASTLLTPLTALTDLELGGSGTTLDLFSSILPRPHQSTATVSQRIPILRLQYTTSLSHASLLTAFSHPSYFPRLQKLDIHLHRPMPRTDTWEATRGQPIPQWVWGDEDWRTLGRTARVRKWVLARNGMKQDVDQSSDEDDEDSEDELDDDALFEPSSEPELELVARGDIDSGDDSDF